MGATQRPIDQILVAIRIPFSYFAQLFTPVMHFQWDNNSLIVIRQVTVLVSAELYALYRVLSRFFICFLPSTRGAI